VRYFGDFNLGNFAQWPKKEETFEWICGIVFLFGKRSNLLCIIKMRTPILETVKDTRTNLWW